MAERRYYRKTYQKNSGKRRIFLVFKILGLILLFCFIGGGFLFIYYAKDLPRPEKFTEKPFIQPTKIYDREGKVLLFEIAGEEKREIIPLEQVSEYLIKAVVVAEDANFYHHSGIDFKGIVRAVSADLKLMKPAQGGSTISQQLIRSSFLTLEKTLSRKIKEVILTLELERRYSKEQILEWYLNQIPFGINIYGVEKASQVYFQKPCQDLTLAQAATMAALIRAPSYLSPYGENIPELLGRKDYILDRLFKNNFITSAEYNEAKKEEIKFAKPSRIKAPFFVFFIESYLSQKYGEDFLKEKGYKVYTTLDWELQEFAEEMVREKMVTNQKYRAFNASLVAINPKTGQILAMVGSKDYFADPYPENCVSGKTCLFDPEVNVAVFGRGRQPGSAFKPFVYATVFKKGFTPDTMVWDAETNFGVSGAKPYIPRNYDGKFRGPVSFREALAQSLNIPSVKVSYLAGLEESIKTAESLGISTLTEKPSYYGLSLVLGGGEVKLLDMVSAYGVFATEGLKLPPVGILKIEDLAGNIIEESQKTPRRVLEGAVCYLINDILSDNESRAPMFGKKSVLYFENYNVAVKTGTTQDFRDGWVMGYTPSIVTGVWVGNNNNAPMAREPGIVVAGPIWRAFMDRVLIKYPPKKDFTKPEIVLTGKPILDGKVDWSNPHSILHYINKDNPQGEVPSNPSLDPQYNNWEEGIKKWIEEHPF